MTKQHFEHIASIIFANLSASDDDAERHAIRGLAWDMAMYFNFVNPNFDRDKFLSACGMVDVRIEWS